MEAAWLLVFCWRDHNLAISAPLPDASRSLWHTHIMSHRRHPRWGQLSIDCINECNLAGSGS
jgi:hypothetical protein